MSDTDTTEQPAQEQQVVRDLENGQITTRAVSVRPIGQEVALNNRGGGVDYARLTDMVDTAKLLCKAGPMIPPWLQENPGGMFAVCMRAQELGISPLTLANWAYVVENGGVKRVGYESQFFHALIEARAPLEERLQYEILGEGDLRKCKIWGTIIGESKPRIFISETLAQLRPAMNDRGQRKGSPLWDKKPEVQLFYNASRDFARIYFPDVLGGMYGRDELIEHGGIEVQSLDSPEVNSLASRLPGIATGKGFDPNSIARALGEAPAEAGQATGAQEPAAEKAPTKPRKGARKPKEEAHGNDEPGTAERVAEDADTQGTGATAQEPAAEVRSVPSEPSTQAEYVIWAERWIGNVPDPDNLEARWDGEKELRAKCRISVTERKRLEGVMKSRAAELRKS